MAGEVVVQIARTATIAGRAIGGVAETVPADYQAGFQQTVPNGSVDYEVDFPITVANILVCAIHSNQNVTLYTNAIHSGSPAQTIALMKNVPLIYSVNEPASAKVLTVDVTKFYISNASGLDAVVNIGVATKQAPAGPA